MRIAIHTVQNAPIGTGMSTYVRGLTRLLRNYASEHHVILVVSVDDESAWRREAAPNWEMVAVRHEALRPKSVGELARRATYDVGLSREARELFNNLLGNCDLVHYTGDRLTPLRVPIPTALSSFAGNYWSLPSYVVFKGAKRQWLTRQSARLSLERANSVLVSSIYQRHVFAQHVGIDPRSIHVVPLLAWMPLLHDEPGTGSEEDNLPRSEDEAYFFYAASTHIRYKNHARILQALHLLRDRWGIRAHVRFTGAPTNELVSLIRSWRLEQQVVFTGFIDARELRDLYRGALAVLHPSLYEAGGSFSMFEAMWYGVPLLCSRLGSMLELTADASWTFDPYDAHDIADAMRRAIIDPDGRRALGERGAEFVRSHSPVAAADQLLEAYEAALSREVPSADQ